jgi:hypothetical protein
VLFEAQLRDPLPRGSRPAAVPIGEKLLLERFVLEYVKINDPPRGYPGVQRRSSVLRVLQEPALFGDLVGLLAGHCYSFQNPKCLVNNKGATKACAGTA